MTRATFVEGCARGGGSGYTAKRGHSSGPRAEVGAPESFHPAAHTARQPRKQVCRTGERVWKGPLNADPSSGVYTVSSLQGGYPCPCVLIYLPGPNRAAVGLSFS